MTAAIRAFGVIRYCERTSSNMAKSRLVTKYLSSRDALSH